MQENMARINDLVTNRVIKKSKSETKDIVIDHEILGVTPEMIDTWWLIMSDADHYKLWHPKDHVWAKLEIKEEGGNTTFTQHILEKIGGIPRLMHLRLEGPNTLSIPRVY